jgi:hypothetical protein
VAAEAALKPKVVFPSAGKAPPKKPEPKKPEALPASPAKAGGITDFGGRR